MQLLKKKAKNAMRCENSNRTPTHLRRYIKTTDDFSARLVPINLLQLKYTQKKPPVK